MASSSRRVRPSSEPASTDRAPCRLVRPTPTTEETGDWLTRVGLRHIEPRAPLGPGRHRRRLLPLPSPTSPRRAGPGPGAGFSAQSPHSCLRVRRRPRGLRGRPIRAHLGTASSRSPLHRRRGPTARGAGTEGAGDPDGDGVGPAGLRGTLQAAHRRPLLPAATSGGCHHGTPASHVDTRFCRPCPGSLSREPPRVSRSGRSRGRAAHCRRWPAEARARSPRAARLGARARSRAGRPGDPAAAPLRSRGGELRAPGPGRSCLTSPLPGSTSGGIGSGAAAGLGRGVGALAFVERLAKSSVRSRRFGKSSRDWDPGSQGLPCLGPCGGRRGEDPRADTSACAGGLGDAPAAASGWQLAPASASRPGMLAAHLW